ncbi:hypothetical protein NQZ68_011457 [Dissostichus eleginoides]|nr:hypothetical protein NQZ68_011457 [Dissostichus eleginoides]
MTKLLPLHPGLGQLVLGSQSISTLRNNTHSATRTDTVHPGQQLALERVEPLIHGRLANIKSAFMAVDGHGTGMVSRVEFRRVLKSLLPVSDTQLLTGLNEVWERSSGTVDYMQFLRRFSRAPTAHRACSSARRCPQNTPMSLFEIQKHLKDKVY